MRVLTNSVRRAAMAVGVAVALLAADTAWTLAAATAPAKEAKAVEPAKSFEGSIADAALMEKAPGELVMADAKQWEKLCTAWGLPDGDKKIDFAKEIVLVGATRGSSIHCKPDLTEAGDLRVAFLSTRDFGTGFRYLVLVVPKEGVKSVNGKPL